MPDQIPSPTKKFKIIKITKQIQFVEFCHESTIHDLIQNNPDHFTWAIVDEDTDYEVEDVSDCPF